MKSIWLVQLVVVSTKGKMSVQNLTFGKTYSEAIDLIKDELLASYKSALFSDKAVAKHDLDCDYNQIIGSYKNESFYLTISQVTRS